MPLADLTSLWPEDPGSLGLASCCLGSYSAPRGYSQTPDTWSPPQTLPNSLISEKSHSLLKVHLLRSGPPDNLLSNEAIDRDLDYNTSAKLLLPCNTIMGVKAHYIHKFYPHLIGVGYTRAQIIRVTFKFCPTFLSFSAG